MLLCSVCVLSAFGMIAFAVMLGCGAMRLGSVFVMFGSLVMFVSCHLAPLGVFSSQFELNI